MTDGPMLSLRLEHHQEDSAPDLRSAREWLELQTAETIGRLVELCCEELRQRRLSATAPTDEVERGAP